MKRCCPRARRIINLYYFADATMKQIGDEIGVNESRVRSCTRAPFSA
jgi:DNA-directed RNA polymerase specialized sigma subunit